MAGNQIFLYIIALLGSMAMFTAVMRIVQPPVEDVNSLARLAVKGPGGEISPWESINPSGGFVDRLDLFLVHNIRLGNRIETMHMLLGKPPKPTPLNILHMKEIATVIAAGFIYYMTDSWQLGLIVAPVAFMMPDFFFKGRIEERQRAIIRNFPSLVDLA
ncbi:MAG: hypothetical protein KGL53_05425, partial [Elusimicrobia bacterium]|nr:hypothetical protein [Elusimicrobiota bacterium]